MKTQPKVSMVITCYNKKPWIEGMFDSVIAQKWNNIEVILVNDGSTDGTREVIEKYEPKLRQRGYEVIVINQENMGVATAVRNGLLKIRGEYFCIPDSDDELDPEYVSIMAERLWQHPEDQWVICDFFDCKWDRDAQLRMNKLYNRRWHSQQHNRLNGEYPEKVYERFILDSICKCVCILMIRTAYAESCGMFEHFSIEPRISQEPQLYIPLTIRGVKPYYTHRKLYHVYVREGSVTQSHMQTYDDRLQWISEYYGMIRRSISSIRQLTEDDELLLKVGSILHEHYLTRKLKERNEPALKQQLAECMNIDISGSGGISIKDSVIDSFFFLSGYVVNKLLGIEMGEVRTLNRRIIAYAAYGRAASETIPLLSNSDIRPDEFWDIKATSGDRIDGIPVKQPDFSSLHKNDTVIILIKRAETVYSVGRLIEEKVSLENIWYYYDVLDYLAEFHYSRCTPPYIEKSEEK